MAEIYIPFVRHSIDIKHQGNKEWTLTLRCDLAVPLALSASMRPISGVPWYFAGGCAGKGGGSSLVMCRAGLGLKPRVWAGLSRAQAYEKSSPTLS
jgi:hypothetical protein